MGWFRNILFKPKYVLYFLRTENGNMYIVKKMSSNKIEKIQKAGGKNFIIDLEHPAYIFENRFTFLLDFETGKQLTYEGVEKQMSPDELDTIVGNKIIRELTAGVIDNKKEKMMYLILGLVMGLLLGLVIMQFIMADKIAAISETSIPLIPTIIGG